MKITIYWVTRNRDAIKKIQDRFNICNYVSVNYETECNVKDEDLFLLKETEKRGFIQVRYKKQEE